MSKGRKVQEKHKKRDQSWKASEIDTYVNLNLCNCGVNFARKCEHNEDKFLNSKYILYLEYWSKNTDLMILLNYVKRACT